MATVNGHAQTARQPAWMRATSRPKIPQHTEPSMGNVLELGEFAGTPSLSASEARLILEAIVKRRRAQQPDFVEPQSLQQMQDYLDTFARFRNPTLVASVDTLLGELPESVTQFETSQLKTLACEDAEEAKTLIPSLTDKVDNATLERLLQEMQAMRHTVGDEERQGA